MIVESVVEGLEGRGREMSRWRQSEREEELGLDLLDGLVHSAERCTAERESDVVTSAMNEVAMEDSIEAKPNRLELNLQG